MDYNDCFDDDLYSLVNQHYSKGDYADLLRQNKKLKEELETLEYIKKDRKNLIFSRRFACFAGGCLFLGPAFFAEFSLKGYLLTLFCGLLCGTLLLFVTGALASFFSGENRSALKWGYLIAAILFPLIFPLIGTSPYD